MTENREFNTIKDVIESTESEFRDFLGDKNIGYCSTLLNYARMQYNNYEIMKNELIKKAETEANKEKLEEIHNTVKGMLVIMMKLEQKTMIICEEINRKKGI